MKPSKYNYIVKLENSSWFINGITECLFEVKTENADDYESILEFPDDQEECFRPFIERMVEMGFIVSDDCNELETIKQKYECLRKKNEYSLMILPTYQCNLRCWYCIQNHQESWINDKVINSIVNRVETVLSKPSINHFNLSWFGGEPLLSYDIVKRLTIELRELAQNNNCTFSSDITTNSTLLNKERIEELHNIGITSYQISIDGKKSIHDKIKVLENHSAFDCALANINEITKHTICNLRFNYTHKTISDYKQILHEIIERIEPGHFRNLQLSLCKVWQEDGSKIDFKIIEQIKDLCNKIGIRVSVPFLAMCYADQFQFECVMPSGKVGLCDNDPQEQFPGELNINGDIAWSSDYNNYTTHLFDDNSRYDSSECIRCKYLPICWGPCPKHRATDFRNGTKLKCKFSDKEAEILDILKKRILFRET